MTMRRHPGRRLAAAVAVLTAAGLLAACGSTGQSAASDLLVDRSDGRQTALVKAAKEEGTVTWYTSLSGPSLDRIRKQFETKYPGVKVKVYRASADLVPTKVEQETRARKASADIVEVDDFALALLAEKGLLQPYHSPAAEKVPAEFKQADGDNSLSVMDRVLHLSFGYNTSMVDQPPASLQDLLTLEVKGKLGTSTGTTTQRWVGGVLHELGDTEGEKFLEKLAARGVRTQPVSGGALADLMTSGQLAGSPAMYDNAIAQRAAKKAPLKWVPLGTVVQTTGGVGIVKDARHPAAAMLLADFLIGAEGAAIFEEQAYSLPTSKVDFEVWNPSSEYKTPEAYAKAYERWNELTRKYFG